MKLSAGQIAPRFEATSYDGRVVASADYAGSKLWLAFFRYASCPLCNQRIHEIIQRCAEFERLDVRIVAVFQSPAERIAEYVGKQGPPFPLVADPEMQLYVDYGVSASNWGLFYPRRIMRVLRRATQSGFEPGPSDGPKATIPADFMIDPEGLVWDSYYGRAISDHVPFETVLRFASDDCLEMPSRVAS